MGRDQAIATHPFGFLSHDERAGVTVRPAPQPPEQVMERDQATATHPFG
jgi:hypothetical protein